MPDCLRSSVSTTVRHRTGSCGCGHQHSRPARVMSYFTTNASQVPQFVEQTRPPDFLSQCVIRSVHQDACHPETVRLRMMVRSVGDGASPEQVQHMHCSDESWHGVPSSCEGHSNQFTAPAPSGVAPRGRWFIDSKAQVGHYLPMCEHPSWQPWERPCAVWMQVCDACVCRELVLAPLVRLQHVGSEAVPVPSVLVL